MKTLKLKFNSDITKLAGNALGKKVYNEQVRNQIDFSDDIIIVFPSGVDRIASSFIQGFFDEFIKNIGIEGVRTRVKIESSIPELKSFIIENLE